MEEVEAGEQYDDLYYVVRDNQPSRVKLLMGQDWDFYRPYGEEGNIISVAIKNSGVEVLAELLGVEYPVKEERMVLPCEKHELLNSLCDADGLTPLMKSASFGRCDAMSLLIACGAEVNAETPRHEVAVDFSLRQADSNVALLLFRADAIFSNYTLREGRGMLNKFIAENRELQELFGRRDKLHNALKNKRFDAEIEAAFEEEVSSYYINRKGESAMWQAALNLNFEAWAYLNDKGAKCASKSEEGDVEIAKLSYEDSFNRSLVKYYFQIKGTHVMKMVSKSIVFRKRRRLEDLGGKVDSFFKALDRDEYTAILLEVLQDEHDLDVVFDFDSSNLEYVHPNLYGKVWGVMDARRRRVYVSAQESENCTTADVIRTLAHELAHKAITVVFQNHGKPYREEDADREREYKAILADVLSVNNLKSCDDIIKRVLTYDKHIREQELIVRVPEMIAKYQEQDSVYSDNEGDDGSDIDEGDGIDRLETQAPKLLKYYREYVMPAFQSYVDKNFTSNRMSVKAMSEYQLLLNAAQCDQVEVYLDIEDFDKYIHYHNGLKILRVSNVRLGQSHLKSVLKKKGESVLCIDWSQLMQSKSEFLEGLANRAIGFMAVAWDQENDPELCKKKRCRNEKCIANSFGGMFENVIVLLPMKRSSLEKGEPIKYKWNDLSEKTKQLILNKKLDFGGEESTVLKLISSVANDEEVENFLATNVYPPDISYLLEEKSICIGKASGWSAEEIANNKIFYHRDCYIKRSLNHGSVKLDELLLKNNFTDILVISNATVLDLSRHGLPVKYISNWGGSRANGDIRCYVLDPGIDVCDEDMIFNEICCQYQMRNGIHHVKFKGGDFLYVKSSGSIEGLLGYINYKTFPSPVTEEEFLDQLVFGKILEATDDSNEVLVPVVIADDPGCGKSFIINNFASELKRKFSDVWISVIDLNFYAQSKSSAHLSELNSIRNLNCDEVIEFLYRMVRRGDSSFEKNLFSSFCKRRHKVIVMFDGFDEICPTYGASVTKFLKALMENTAIKVVVTTRLHEKYNLEKSLNYIAYKLVPFSLEEQILFLDGYWNLCLKNVRKENRLNKMRDLRSGMERWLGEDGEGDIIHALHVMDNAILEAESKLLAGDNELEEYRLENVNFEIYGKNLLIRINILSKDVDQFTQTPLHIQMTAFIAFEDDFNLDCSLNLGHLYQRFFEIKMKIFDVSKAISSGNVSAGKAASMVQDRAYQILEKLSANLFFDPNHYKCKKSDMVNALSIGLVAEKEETYQFMHRTFGEFFFAKWLLRKSNKELVTKFWLQDLFSNKGLFRVRCFLEDIVYLKSIAFSQSEDNSLDDEKVLLNPSALPEHDLSRCINACLFSIIVNFQLALLQYFADAFGVEVVKHFLGDNNFPSGDSEEVDDCVQLIMKGFHEKPIDIVPIHLNEICLPESRIYYHPKLKMSEPASRYNAFTLACRKMSIEKHTEKYIQIVKKMLALIKEYSLANLMSEMISKHGLNWLLPSSMKESCYENYLTELVSFLTGEHKEIFRNSLKKAFLDSSGSWKSGYGKNMALFHLMRSLSDEVLDESEFSTMFLENKDFFKFWTCTVLQRELSVVTTVWEYVLNRLTNKEQELEFITMSEIDRTDFYHPKFVNVLTMAALNSDSMVINFVWEVATSLMHKEIYMEWLYRSFILGKPSDSWNRCVPPNVFKFLESLLAFGYLSEDEMVDLILSKDSDGKCYFLCINDSTFNICNMVFSFYNFLSCSLKSRAGEILVEMKSLLWTIIIALANGTGCSQAEDVHLRIEAEFENLVKLDTFGLMDDINNDFVVGAPSSKFKVKDFKFFMVMFYRGLKLESEGLGKDCLFERLIRRELVVYKYYNNVLSFVINRKVPFMLGFVCAILMQFVQSEDIIQLLFMINSDGDNVFHEAAMKKDYYSWGKLYDAARILLKEKAFSEVHTIGNKDGECVHDIFLKS